MGGFGGDGDDAGAGAGAYGHDDEDPAAAMEAHAAAGSREEEDEREEDVEGLRFGKGFTNVQFLSNVEVSLLLQRWSKNVGKGGDDVVDRTLAYVQKFGAPGVNPDAAVQLREKMSQLLFDLEEPETGTTVKIPLHPYQIVALWNLNPSDVAAANHLVPMLRSKFKEEDVQTMLTTISRSTARMMGT